MAHAAARRPFTGALMNASRRTLASKAPAGASSTALPVVIHGKRTIKAGMVEEFRRHYDTYSKAMFERPGIKAVYAFADKNDPLSYWHVTFASDTASFDAARALVAQSDAAVQLASTYTAPNDDDTLVLPPHVTTTRDAETVPGASRLLDKTPVLAMAQRTRRYVPDTLNVYGSWSDLAAFNIDQSVRHVVRSRLAGYIKSEGAAQPGPPLLGFTRRHVKPGRIEQLAASFQVHREAEQANVVHDLRIFANHAAFQAHTDKSDPELTAAMEAWFDHYDTSEPFTGQLYYPGASAADDGLRTSSIKERPVRVGFDEFSFGEQGAMLGPMPDMDKQ